MVLKNFVGISFRLFPWSRIKGEIVLNISKFSAEVIDNNWWSIRVSILGQSNIGLDIYSNFYRVAIKSICVVRSISRCGSHCQYKF